MQSTVCLHFYYNISHHNWVKLQFVLLVNHSFSKCLKKIQKNVMEYRWQWTFSAQYQSWQWWHTLILNIVVSAKHWPTCPFLAASTLPFFTQLTLVSFFLLHHLSKDEQEKMMYILLITVSFTVQRDGILLYLLCGELVETIHHTHHHPLSLR